MNALGGVIWQAGQHVGKPSLLSLASYHFFEYPAQQFLRRKLLSKSIAQQPATAR